MPIYRSVTCTMLLLAVVAAAPLVAGAQAPGDDAASSAMQRARRQAENPLRMILEASKFSRKGADADVAADGAAAARPPAASKPAAPAEAVLVASAGFGEPLATAVTALGPVGQAEPSALGDVEAPPRPELAAMLVPLKLVNMVEPDVPRRTLEAIGRTVEVDVDLTIRADGSVADLAVDPAAPSSLQRYITEALAKWRYAPLPAQRVLRVQLVFNPG